jgi:hypothetical protein
MNTKLNNLFGCLAVLGLLILPVVLFLALVGNGKVASGKQVTFDRARASLLAALGDDHAGSGVVGEPKQYGNFLVYACTNTVIVDGSNYPLAVCTVEWYQFANQGRLAVTTNRQFIWLDDRRGPKLILEDYKVSRWRTGY